MTTFRIEKEIWALESPIPLTEGDAPVYTLVYHNVEAVSASGAAQAIYKGSTDTSSTNLSGSITTSGNSLKSKAIASLVGGANYVLVTTAPVDGVTMIKKVMFNVQRAKDLWHFGDDSDIWPIEGVLPLTAGESPVLKLVYKGATFVNSTGATQALYKGSTDVSSTCLTGSITTVGNCLTSKTITGLVGGATYILVTSAPVDGVTEIRKVMLVVQRPKEVQ